MSGHDVQMLFNPQQSSLKQLEGTLTAKRRVVAESLIAQLQEAVQTGSSFNNLLIGPRGSGKTHVISYVRKFLEERFRNEGGPIFVKLSEEERGIQSLYDLVVACLRAIMTDPRSLMKGMPRKPEERLTHVRNLFDEKLEGRATIVFLENLADLFAALEDTELHALRHFLQERPHVSVLASSITLFQESSRLDHPFYGYFTPHHLNSLSAEQSQVYLGQLAAHRDALELARLIMLPETLPRVRAIHALTGGNHRLLGLLSEFLTEEDLDKLVPAFLRMADRELTAYYQQRMDRLSNQQVKIVRALADGQGEALTVTEIAEYTALTPQATSRLLVDLRSAEWVVAEKQGRESYYDLREPLVRLVFELKAGYETLPSIVGLLRTWYTPDELKGRMAGCGTFSRGYVAAALDWRLENECALAERRSVSSLEAPQEDENVALIPLTGQHGIELGETSFDNSELQQAVQAIEEHRLEVALDVLEHAIHSRSGKSDFVSLIETGAALFMKGQCLAMLGRSLEAIAVYQEVVSRYDSHPVAELQELIARAMLSMGYCLDTLDRSLEAITVYDELVARFGDRPEASSLACVAMAKFNKGFCLNALNRSLEAITVYDELVTRFGDRPEASLLMSVAMALLCKGYLIGELDRPLESIAVYDELVARLGDRPEASLLTWVAKALCNKGLCLGALDRSLEAIVVYDEVVTRFGDRPEASLLEQVAKALLSKGASLGKLNRSLEAIAICEEVISRFDERPEAALLEWVASALYGKGVMLEALDRPLEAIVVFDEVAMCFGDRQEASLLVWVARALYNKGFRLGELGRSLEEIAIYDEVVSRFGNRPEAALLEWLANALFGKGGRLSALDRPLEAIVVYDEVVTRCGDRPEASLQHRVAKALFHKGVILGRLERSLEAIAIYDEVLTRISDRSEASLLEWAAKALYNKGIILGGLERSLEAIAIYDDVVSRFGDRPEAVMQERVAMALYNKGVILNGLDRSLEAIAVYDEVVSRFGESLEAALLEWVAMALYDKGVILGGLGRSLEAIAVYDEVFACFSDRPEASLLAWVAMAACDQGLLLIKDGRPEVGLDRVFEGFRLASRLGNKGGFNRDIIADILTTFTSFPSSLGLRALSPLLGAPEELAEGLIQWLKQRLPLDAKDSQHFAWVHEVMEAALEKLEEGDAERADLDGLRQAIRLIAATKEYTSGDDRALFKLPLELRRLLEPEEAEDS
ncbi:MAG: tetratricopeptide repeat protein [Candidatus Hydrogenedentes bacterium]|nr:tetratricopeptide repeat protein [Candidatus Hydrogenedentota bacterium]